MNGVAESDTGARPGAGVVAFLFGVAETTSLPGPALVRLLGDVGLTESAARSLLARLRRSGDLRTSRSGRTATYTLTGAMLTAWRRGDALGRGHTADPWDGTLHGILWSVPETHRAYRDHLRRLARLAGYAPLHPGLFVSVADHWRIVADQAGQAPPGARVGPLELRMDPADAAAAARDAWNLDALAGRCRALTVTLQRSREAQVTPGPESLRRFVETAHPVYTALVADPGLPAELLPDDWPMPLLLTELHAVLARYHEPLSEYLREILDGA